MSALNNIYFINPIDFSLKQNITRLVRQAFIHYCKLHQVWEPPSITTFFMLLGFSEQMLWIQSMPRVTYGYQQLVIGCIHLGLTIIV